MLPGERLRILSEGEQAGFFGDPRSGNPYPRGTRAFVVWDCGWLKIRGSGGKDF